MKNLYSIVHPPTVYEHFKMPVGVDCQCMMLVVDCELKVPPTIRGGVFNVVCLGTFSSHFTCPYSLFLSFLAHTTAVACESACC